MIIEKSGKWLHFSNYEGNEGWIHRSLVKKVPTVITKGIKCNIRKGHGTSYNISATVGKGIPFKIIKREGTWVNIQHAGGFVGWIHKNLVFTLNTFAQKNSGEDISIILPSQSIPKFLSNLLPYKINMGKHFSGTLQLKSIKNFKIEKNKISFSSHIHGKDIIYTPNVSKKSSSIKFGNVNLFNDWESAFRFEDDKKTLYIIAHLKKQAVTKETGQNEFILNTLFKVMSDIEYPIDLQKLSPITAEFLGNVVNINFDVSNIYATNNKLTIKLRPIPKNRKRI